MCAMGDEVLGDKIPLTDILLHVTSPIRKGVAEDLGCFAHAFRPIRRTGEWRVMVDERWIEVPVDGCQVTIGEQGGDELTDDLLVRTAGHAAMVGCRRSLHHPSKVGCFLVRIEGKIAVWTEAARSRGAQTISRAAVPQDFAAQRSRPRECGPFMRCSRRRG